MMVSWYNNGLNTDKISIDDRGLQYADGLFETIAIRNGRPRLWELHSDRMQTGCRRLGIQVPDKVNILRSLVGVIEAEDLNENDALLKIIITRGQGNRGYAPPRDANATILFGVYQRSIYTADLYEKGVSVRFCQARMASQPQTAGMKLLCRLDQVRARSEWHDPEIAEGLMLDQDGTVVSGTMSNLFIVDGDELVTPEITHCGVSGVMRQHILALAVAHDLTVRVSRLSPDDVKNADEVFLCNSQFGIWPVSFCGNTRKDDWPLTRKMTSLLRESGVIEGLE